MTSSLGLRAFARCWFGYRRPRAFSPRAEVSSRRRVRPRLEVLEDRITPSTFTPTTFADDGTAISLRGVLTQANNDTGTATDTIQLQAGTYVLTIANSANNHDVSNSQGDLNITNTSHALVIQGTTDASGKPITIIQQTVLDRVFQIVNPGTTVTFRNVVIEGGKAQDDGSAGAAAGSTEADGGGILANGDNVTLTNVVLRSNQAQAGPTHYATGGGLYATDGSLTITNSVIQNNLASAGAGTSGSQGGSGIGGGIYTYGSSSSSVFIAASTIWGNQAIGGDAGGSPNAGYGYGGGAYISTNAQIINSTVADNGAVAGSGANAYASGGGIEIDLVTATLTNVTVVHNTVSVAQAGPGDTNGGGIRTDLATVTLVNTLVALNRAGTGPDFRGDVSNSDHNLIGIQDGSNGFSAAHGDRLGTLANPLDPQLGPLTDNGGPTPTLALLPGSPARNAGDNTAQAVIGPNDQRGYPRVAEGIIDIGAFEYQPPPPSPPSGGGGGGGTTAAPPSLFQALLSLFIDGASLEATQLANEFVYGDDFNLDNYYGSPSQLAVVRANAAAAGINYDTVMALSSFLSRLRGFYAIQPDIAANAPYAGPFAEFAVIAGAQAVYQAVQL